MEFTTMKKSNSNEEILSRREFFKKAAKTALPIFGAIVAGSILSSCEPYEGTVSCGDCTATCEGGCSGDCDNGCSGDCWNACTDLCLISCYIYGR